jgi:hypothetical protein
VAMVRASAMLSYFSRVREAKMNMFMHVNNNTDIHSCFPSPGRSCSVPGIAFTAYCLGAFRAAWFKFRAFK